MTRFRCARCTATVDADISARGPRKDENICDSCEAKRTAIGATEMLAVLSDIEAGVVTLTTDEPWAEVYCGNVTFRTSTGWTVVVFNDCDDWDYIDSLIAPDGRRVEFEDLPADVQNWAPSPATERLFESAPRG
jgi:hypothetical protein